MAFNDFLATLASQVVVAALTAFITVKLALRRFYSEKWWERKLAAYTTVIEALSHILNFIDREAESYFRGEELSEERQAELATLSHKGRDELARAASLGTFLISQQASFA